MNTESKLFDHYLLCIGGTSVRQALANSHYRFMEWLYRQGSEFNFCHTIVPAMDQANPDLRLLENIAEAEKQIMGTELRLAVIRLSDLQDQAQAESESGQKVQQSSRFGDNKSPVIRDHIFFTAEDDNLDTKYGYCSNQSVGSVIGPQVFEKAFEITGDTNSELSRIVEKVINSNGNQAVHVIFCGASTWGGEGRTHTNILPDLLHRKCAGKIVETGRMTEAEADRHVRDHLLSDVIMHGAYFHFPSLEKDKDVKRLTEETLANFDTDSSSRIHTFALVDHDLTCVLAEKPSEYANQFRHGHAAELVACEITEKLLQRPFDGQRCLIPHYAVAGPQTNWETLAASDETRRMMISFLRFFAILKYFLKPQLGTGLADLDEKNLYYSRILAIAYGAYGSALKEHKTRDDIEAEVLVPFWTMYKRAELIARWICEIALTGRDWQTGDETFAQKYTSLFNVEEIKRLTDFDEKEGNRKETRKEELPRIDQFQLDALSACEEGNPAATGLTPDGVILRLGSQTICDQYTFTDLMKKIYDIVRI